MICSPLNLPRSHVRSGVFHPSVSLRWTGSRALVRSRSPHPRQPAVGAESGCPMNYRCPNRKPGTSPTVHSCSGAWGSFGALMVVFATLPSADGGWRIPRSPT